jgi:hypothetical protein
MRRPTLHLTLLGLLALAGAFTLTPASAQTQADFVQPPVYASGPEIQKLKADLYLQGERNEMRREMRHAKQAKARAKHGKPGVGTRSRRGGPTDLVLSPVARALSAGQIPGAGGQGTSLLTIPTNVRMSNPTGEPTGSAQSEVSVATLGPFGLSAWNDGQSFVVSTAVGQGVAYTTNGGSTWVDVNGPAIDPGNTFSDWFSDPVVALNEKTGTFWFCGLVEDTLTGNEGVATASATFPGGVFTWGTTHTVQMVSGATDLFDKEWMVADSVSGNLYLTYTHFTLTGDFIEFRRSTDAGVSWDPPVTISSNFDNGFVQGARPVVAGDGTLYVVWRVLGAPYTSNADFLKVRRSTNAGVSFDPENTAASYFDNFGTGGPGFNRNRDVVEPCPAVDRSVGPHRGRLAVVAHEALNFYPAPLGGAGSKNEIENNNGATAATPFTPGQRLRGVLNGTPVADRDWWSFPATQGTTYVFYVDSTNASLPYTFRVFCSGDTGSSLAFGGQGSPPNGNFRSVLVWTAPSTATYYLRLVFLSGGATSARYRLQTGVATHGTEPGRDQRDVVVRYSDDGGVTWSGPSLANDDAALYDNFMPEIGFTREGYLYSAWYDFRNLGTDCSGSANVYVARSRDGGATWDPSQLISTKPTSFSKAPTNIAPNMGDYIGLYAGDNIALGWGDGRVPEDRDVDVWGAVVRTGFTAACPADTTADPNTTINLADALTNLSTIFDQPLAYSVTADRAWPGLPSGTTTLAAEASASLPLAINVPDTAAAGPVQVCVTVSLPNGTLPQQCCFNVTVNHTVGVPTGGRVAFALYGAQPNPARDRLAVSLALPSAAPARLELIDMSGRRVLSRDVGALGVGFHVVQLDREVAALPAGVYALRLVQSGREVDRKVSILR